MKIISQMEKHHNEVRAILISILESEKLGFKPFKIDLDICYYPFHRKIALSINETLKNGNTMTVLFSKIESSVFNTNYSQDFLDLIATNPIGTQELLERIYKELVSMSVKYQIKGQI